MKYSNNNKPLVCMMTQSTNYVSDTEKIKKGKTAEGMITVKGVLWHSTGANNPWLKRYVQPDDNAPDRQALLNKLGKNPYNNDWNHIYRGAGLNAWIGKLADGSVATVQSMPWNYKPWGCGGGRNGSCNDGWIQFEICEDALNDKAYFEAVYKEACELTAYLCKMYNLAPKGTIMFNGIKVPVILCHKDSANLGLGCDHIDVLHWLPKFGKSMEDVRNDVAALMKDSGDKTTDEIYRVRKSWADSKSQIGAYKVLDNAKKQADANKAAGYKVFDSKGIVVYEPQKAAAKKTVTQLANEVIRGLWGAGKDRKDRLTAAGYDYAVVQKKVNELMKK